MFERLDNNNLDLINELNSISGFKISCGIYDSIYLYKLNAEIIGFINFSIIYDRSELNYIFVLQKYRKKGYAKKMIDFLIDYVENNNCSNITLEVRCSNISAIKFYEKNGFKKASIRKNYYDNELFALCYPILYHCIFRKE